MATPLTKKPFERLPSTVTPVNYEISLTPNLTDFVFEGTERVQVRVHQPVDRITLNAIELTIVEPSEHNKVTVAGRGNQLDETRWHPNSTRFHSLRGAHPEG